MTTLPPSLVPRTYQRRCPKAPAAGCYNIIQDGVPNIAKLPYKWLNSMVYGRYDSS